MRTAWTKRQQSGGPRGDAEVRGGRFRSRKGVGSRVRQARARPSTFRVRQARARPSNTSIRDLLSDDRYTEAVLAFLGLGYANQKLYVHAKLTHTRNREVTLGVEEGEEENSEGARVEVGGEEGGHLRNCKGRGRRRGPPSGREVVLLGRLSRPQS